MATDVLTDRPAWLVLGADALAARLPDLVRDVEVRRVETTGLQVELAHGRPRVVIVAQPPASAEDIDVVVAQRRARTSLRAVLLTEPDDLPRRLAALAADFDDALPASIDDRELAARVRRLTAPARSTRRSLIAVSEHVQLDLQACELQADGRPQRLRPKEFQLLALLATHPRRAFTRQELLERVWGRAFTGDARTIDVHLRWLRSKVEADPERPVHLVTVRGRGHRFDPP